ncbi:hypothetical protein JCM10213_007464 [Rhodosporidiobolus nylandii]
MPPNPYLKALAPGASASGSPSARSAKKERRQSAAAAAKGKGKAASTGADEQLRAEILALGGDEEDLKMLEDVESESEVEEGGEEGEAGLVKDLKSFMKGLDFSAAGATAPASDDDEGASSGASDDDEEEEMADAPAAAPAPVEAAKEEKPAKEKKESKHEREERRRVEREAEKEKEQERKELERAEREVKRKAQLEKSTKSPWIVDPTPHWYAVPVPAPSPSASKPSPSLVAFLQQRGQTLLDKENQLFSASLDPKASSKSTPAPTGLSKADQVFIQQILSSGTSSDKVSALLLLVSSSPLHNTTYLDQLAALCRKKSRDESGRAVRGVVDWWRGEGGGSPDRKLRYFADQPSLATVAHAHEALEKGRPQDTELERADVDRCLVLFAFEDWFKKWFFQVLQALEQMSVDPLPHPRNQAVIHLSNLLRDKPEQESNILRLLCNKLGDTQRSIASKTSHHLLQVLQRHPGMTPIMVREVSALILHPRTSLPSASSAAAAPAASGAHVRFGGDSDDEADGKKKKEKKDKPAEPPRDHARDNSRYYGVTTLNQVMLKKEQGEVAGKMVDVYFEVFGDVLGRLPDLPSEDEGEGEKEGEKVAGKKRARDERDGGKGKGKKGKKEAPQDAVNDVDAKLVAAVLTGINRAFPFAKLDDDAFKRRLDTLFRITHTSTFNVSIQALMLIYHVSSAKKDITDRFYRALYTSLHDPRLTHSSKQALYLNLFFRATKADKDAGRTAALVKRLIQILPGMETTFVLGALYVVGELIATAPGLRDLLTVPEAEKKAVAAAEPAKEKKDGVDVSTVYDGKKREPRYAGALNSCLWELTPLLTHYHPTVAAYASSLLAGETLSSASDLEQYSLAHFLDRFVYREAKKAPAAKGSSMMQSGLAGQDKSGRVSIVKGGAATEEAVNSEKFRRRNVHDVPVDQQFFHHYFTSKTSLSSSKSAAATKRKSRRGGKGSDDESGDESVSEASIGDLGERDREKFDEDALDAAMDAVPSGDEEDGSDFEVFDPDAAPGEDETDEEMEAEIWKAMKASMPKEKGDSDLDLSDLDAGDASSAQEDDEDEDAEAFDYDSDDLEDEEAKEALRKIKAELAGAGAAAPESDDDDLREDDMDELPAFSGASDDDDDEAADEEEFAGISDASGGEEEPFVSAFPDEDALSGEDDDGFLENDEDVFGSDEDVELGDAGETDSEDERRQAKKAKKRKLKSLPMFASADDYAHLVGGSDDEEI